MVASIGKIASPSQGASYYERDGYYARDDPAHREASAWVGEGAAALGLSGPVDPDTFTAILEGRVPDGPRLGKRDKDGNIHHRPGRDVTLSAPKSVSLLALIGGDARIVAAHDEAVGRTLAWIEKNAIETRMRDPAGGGMIRASGQKTVVATFQHDTSRNLDPQLHTHCVIANMVQGGDGKWRTMVDDGLYAGKMAIGAIYRAELAQGLSGLGYRIEKAHGDGRFEVAGVPRAVIEAFSTRRAEIEAAMAEHGLGETRDDPHLAARANLMTRASKRDVDRGDLGRAWERQAAELGFSAGAVRENVRQAERERPPADPFASRDAIAADAASWAMAHLSERNAVFGHTDLLTAALSREPGTVTIEAAERAVAELERQGGLHAATGLDRGRFWTTDAALARESETLSLMRAGQGAGKTIMRRWIAETRLHRGRLTEGQKEAVKTVLASKDRVVGVQGYAGTGKTTMLNRLRVLTEHRGYKVAGLAPSASAARTLEAESGIASETLQRFLARHEGIAEGRGTAKGLRDLRASFSKTILVVDESSLASSEQMRGLLRVATALRLPRVVLVGDEKQLDGVDAGKPFAQLKRAGMQTAAMDEILRQRDERLKEAVRASLAGEMKTAFAKLGDRVSQVDRAYLGLDTAERWLELSPRLREATGVIAPTRALRDEINETVRNRLIEEGAISGPTRQGEKLVSRGLTKAEMSLHSTYAAGDTVIFTRRYKTLGVEKGDEREVAKVDREAHTVHLRDGRGNIVEWKPWRLAGAKGGVEVYRSEAMELRAGDRVRFTRNDPGSGLVNGRTAEVESVEKDSVRFRLEDGTMKQLNEGDPQLRHLDRAWASTVHAFQGRTVDRIIAAMPSGHAHLTTQKAFYVAISRARDSAELVTDDARRLADRLEKATGERVAALDAAKKYVVLGVEIGGEPSLERGDSRARKGRDVPERVREPDRNGEHEQRAERETGHERDRKSPGRAEERKRADRASDRRGPGIERGGDRSHEPQRDPGHEKTQEPNRKSVDMDFGL